MQTILVKALLDAEKSLPGGRFKAVLHSVIAGNLGRFPFLKELLDRVRTDLRLTLKRFGFGDGLPQEGDRVQHFEVRLTQELLRAFGDPDAIFCEFRAKGVWLGSRTSKLPWTPAVFNRKVKWKYAEPTEPLNGEWKANYPSVREHAATVNKQFLEEGREGLMTQISV